MTDPDTDPSNLSPNARLDKAKERFREDMLDNDEFFAVVAKKLESDYHTKLAGLPDFTCEPTLTIRGNREFWAVRLAYSRTSDGEHLIVKESSYEYIKIAERSPGERIYQPESSLLAELRRLDVRDIDAAAEAIIQQWIAGMNMLHADPAMPVGINPRTGAIELLEELQRTAYSLDSEE